MSDLARGKRLFGQLVEYPLPATPGVRDYVVDFLPPEDGYGKGRTCLLG